MTTTRHPGARPTLDQPPRSPPEPSERRASGAVVAVRRIFAAETSEYFLLLGTTIFLVVFGLVMVLSSSSIESRVEDGDFFAKASRQGLYALIGLPLMLIAARAPIVVLEALGLARDDHRDRRRSCSSWRPTSASATATTATGCDIGSFTAQPSEVVKLALIIWLAWILTTKAHQLNEWKQVAAADRARSPAAAILFVLFGNDLGTAIILRRHGARRALLRGGAAADHRRGARDHRRGRPASPCSSATRVASRIDVVARAAAPTPA